jgi:hypothetical protein
MKRLVLRWAAPLCVLAAMLVLSAGCEPKADQKGPTPDVTGEPQAQSSPEDDGTSGDTKTSDDATKSGDAAPAPTGDAAPAPAPAGDAP